MSSELPPGNPWLVHSHCPTCGQACLWEPVAEHFIELDTAAVHVCVPADELVCSCGALLARSAFGIVFENDREGPKPHFCTFDVDRAEVELAQGRGAWRRPDPLPLAKGVEPVEVPAIFREIPE